MNSLRRWWSETFGDGEDAGNETFSRDPNVLHATKTAARGAPPPAPRRRVFVNLPLPDSFLDAAGFPTVEYPANKIRTSKYTVFTFLPKNLWEQFHRIANGRLISVRNFDHFSERSVSRSNEWNPRVSVFFLAMAISQVFGIFQVTNAFMPFLPLIIVLGLTAIKDGWEDYKRHKSDAELNRSQTRKLDGFHNVNYVGDSSDDSRRLFDGTWIWKFVDFSLKILPFFGSLLRPKMQRRRNRVREHQEALLRQSYAAHGRDTRSGFPPPLSNGMAESDWKTIEWANLRVGDFILLQKNDLIPADIVVLSTSDPDNLCYVETKNLDGETNLKSKVGHVDLRFLDSADACRRSRLWLDSEGPNLNLYSYTGVIMLPADLAPDDAAKDARNSMDSFRSPSPTAHVRSTLPTVQEIPTFEFSTVAKPAEPIEPDHSAPETRPGTALGLSAVLPNGTSRPESPSRERISFAAEDRTEQGERILGRQSTGTQTFTIVAPPTERPPSTLVQLAHRVSLSLGRPSGQHDMPPPTEPHHSVPLNISNLLLRGSVLRNTEWVIGLVAYTGAETKILLNGGKTPHKRSRIERKMNIQVLIVFALLVLLCLGVTIAHMYFNKAWATSGAPWYNPNYSTGVIYGLITFWSAMILFQNLIPISLYVTIEIAKIFQAFFIFMDSDMFYNVTNQPCVPKNWSIADDLGQVSYIFSDKTGTLTANKMEFRKCDVRGTIYGESGGTAQDGTFKGSSNISSSPDVPAIFHDAKLFANMAAGTTHSAEIDRFFTCLALCHTVATSIDPQTGAISYNAESPDEQALVMSARDVGYVLVERTQKKIVIDVRGQRQSFQLLQVLEFNSARKRMSVILRPDSARDEVLLLTKGADSIIFPRLAPGDDAMKAQTQENLERFAEEGLRTLCLAQRVIPMSEYRQWKKEYDAAASALSNRDAALEASYDVIESQLTLLGTTAIEDRLQDAVPECIALLREAGIKIWVLTGDKLETAINIGYSCNLLDAGMDLVVVRGATNAAEAYTQLLDARARVTSRDHEFNLKSHHKDAHGADSVRMAVKVAEEIEAMNLPLPRYGLVIDGESMKHAFETEEGAIELMRVGLRCRSVICCRVTPKQKAMVVRLAKKYLGCMCLAIGDGANDVGMIQEANVGVGIAGAEGLQAAMASDYVLGQFRFLAKLVLVHGRWSYMRCSEMVLNFFYKCIVWVFSLFWYQCFAGFSTDVLFEYTFILFFNLIFTSLPVLVIGIFEQDVNADTSLKVPQLYLMGIRQQLFTVPRL